jgi:hypothetical protein
MAVVWWKQKKRSEVYLDIMAVVWWKQKKRSEVYLDIMTVVWWKQKKFGQSLGLKKWEHNLL